MPSYRKPGIAADSFVCILTVGILFSVGCVIFFTIGELYQLAFPPAPPAPDEAFNQRVRIFRLKQKENRDNDAAYQKKQLEWEAEREKRVDASLKALDEQILERDTTVE